MVREGCHAGEDDELGEDAGSVEPIFLTFRVYIYARPTTSPTTTSAPKPQPQPHHHLTRPLLLHILTLTLTALTYLLSTLILFLFPPSLPLAVLNVFLWYGAVLLEIGVHFIVGAGVGVGARGEDGGVELGYGYGYDGKGMYGRCSTLFVVILGVGGSCAFAVFCGFGSCDC